MSCERCGGCGWVCENHPDMPFNHGFCPWPGDPCPMCASELLTGHKLIPKLTKLEGEAESDAEPSST